MFDLKSNRVRTEMRMRRKWFVELLQQVSIGAFACRMHCNDDVVANTEHTRRHFGLDEIAHYFVIKVVDLGPFDAFLLVFFLNYQAYLELQVHDKVMNRFILAQLLKWAQWKFVAISHWRNWCRTARIHSCWISQIRKYQECRCWAYFGLLLPWLCWLPFIVIKKEFSGHNFKIASLRFDFLKF